MIGMSHPYVGRPDYQFWKKAPGHEGLNELDPVVRISFTIKQSDPVVTAGSCFAQHVSRYLANSGFNFLVTENAHPIIPERYHAALNYGLFTARYGNIYSARQLRQLLERAYGLFQPIETVWPVADGYVVDPFRPQIQQIGFLSQRELDADRVKHFAAVRGAIETLSVFVFTLGLTEAWEDRRDHSVFPLAPGVAGGRYDPDLHAFVNFTVDEVVRDLIYALDFIRSRNPGARFILTVSPVPLAATAVDRHVLVSTSASKAVLRVAADLVAASLPLTDYFPSYEIITSPHARGSYYEEDCRSVTQQGVDHVMRLFLNHYGRGEEMPSGYGQPTREAPLSARVRAVRHIEKMTSLMSVLCDEERITKE